MTIYPESAKPWFNTVIDWLREWACARTTGFGTPLPWGKGWIIETLSDSTVYMAFYTINKHIKQHNINPLSLKPEVFDYIFYGKGNVTELSKDVGSKRSCWIQCGLNSYIGTHLTFETQLKNLCPTIFHSASSTTQHCSLLNIGQEPSA
jgi:leucyl-tRNA synthetase